MDGLKTRRKGVTGQGVTPAKPRHGHSICGAIKRNWPDRDREQVTDEKKKKTEVQ